VKSATFVASATFASVLITALIPPQLLQAGAPITDLRVTLVDAPDPVVTGEPLVYVATVKSVAGRASSIELILVLPPGIILVRKQVDLGPGSGMRKAICDGAKNDQVIRCAVNSLGPDEYFRVRVTVQSPAPALLRSFAFVHSASRDQESRNNFATTATSCING